MKIDWTALTSRFWKPEPNKHYIVMFCNWRAEEKVFKDTDGARLHLVMDVVALDGVSCETKEFSTRNFSFINKIRPIIEHAEAQGKDTVEVYLERDSEHNYNVIDREVINKVIKR